MNRRQRIKRNKNVIRDSLTNKIITHQECIMVKNAIDYIKKQGYIVIQPPRSIRDVDTKEGEIVLAERVL